MLAFTINKHYSNTLNASSSFDLPHYLRRILFLTSCLTLKILQSLQSLYASLTARPLFTKLKAKSNKL